ncbi:serine/threonine-protein kinase Nek10 isoform X1 [Corythoichthys intestinalis]|uniref:serine/threonine-protein kinase Nek10 isoform X1 n=1 Tax=Corythoichthys intestinalis TaxID=161448 RepID=UPI0025A57C42|nr:serine/threonine-protein kinase Nek10 isoform X1 [Corythoichthys intestinalis]
MTQTRLKMSKQVKKGDKQALKSTGIHNETCDLRRLQALLAKSSPKREVLSHNKADGNGFHSPHPPNHSCAEESELDKFSLTYREMRCFSSHPLQKLFANILTLLVKNRLCSHWMEVAPPDWALGVLLCLRLLIRDPQHQKMFHHLQGVHSLARYMKYVADMSFASGQPALAAQSLVTMTYMCQKLTAVDDQRLIESGVHTTLVKLLSSSDSGVLLGALTALTTLAESPQCREPIGELILVENLVHILQDCDYPFKRMAAELLRLVSQVGRVRDELRDVEAVPVLLSLLHMPHLRLLWSVAWVLVQLCQDAGARAEVRSWGGVHMLLKLLSSNKQFFCNRSSLETPTSADTTSQNRTRDDTELIEESDIAAVQSACCTALTELSLDDSCAHHIVQENGIYILAKLILPQISGPKVSSLQCYAFRALRFLFGVERNRCHFKRLFPADLYEAFIDVGHYVRDLEAYEALRVKVSQYSEEELESLRASITAVDQNQPALKVINGYAVLEHLGTGAFGSVFKARKQNTGNLLALKEVNLHNPAFGKDKKSRDCNVEKIIAELAIIKEQMAHPNIVKYYKTFLQDDKLYIVMELIDGVPLLERCNSLKEKRQRFTEELIWTIFIQMCLALRYLHKDKHIVHRDLTPNNIMLGDNHKVTITDFGLAKQKQENSKLTSVVGTILYSCPEVVKNEPYGEKADIWALGCVLFQMATLEPPFYSDNMLSLASKIVEAIYEPLEDGVYSERLEDMIAWCLSPDPERRPDIVAVGSRIADLAMMRMDALYASHNALERRAERDRKRAQRYFLEGHRGGKTCSCSVRPQEEILINGELANFLPSQPEENLRLEDASDHEDVKSEDTQTPHYRSKSSARAGICVSQRNLRQIEDPIHKLLEQLHKVLYVTQLPPSSRHDVKRRLVERFKKSLFQIGSDPHDLKTELSKLAQGSCEVMESSSAGAEWWPVSIPITGDAAEGDNLREGVTYEQMQTVLEELLDESGYYRGESGRQATPGIDRHPRS